MYTIKISNLSKVFYLKLHIMSESSILNWKILLNIEILTKMDNFITMYKYQPIKN